MYRYGHTPKSADAGVEWARLTCTLYLAWQEVFRAIWEDSSVWAGYHHSCDHPDAVVSPWQSDERRVTFSTPLKAPAFIKKLVGQWCLQPFDTVFRRCVTCFTWETFENSAAGVEVLEIIETQLLQRQADGSLVVESRPVLAAPGASKFTTHALFTMTEAVNGRKSCKVPMPCIADGVAMLPSQHTLLQHVPEELYLQCGVMLERNTFGSCCWHSCFTD